MSTDVSIGDNNKGACFWAFIAHAIIVQCDLWVKEIGALKMCQYKKDNWQRTTFTCALTF